MKDLQEYSSDFDRWIFLLLEMLRSKYFDVEVLRYKRCFQGSKEKVLVYDFRYYDNEPKALNMLAIPKTTLDEHYESKTTPQQILDLIK